ncbi:FHA domain-containing protein [Brevibacterium sp.]|uniref:FHA domain-containing protein FhaB/FipA n=1 Tax=Brevibacterium sp. TaxID=1701 RepID=UPI0025B81480|nr:FHA domain-containing protein [Brevibacterium sp.]
MSEFTVTVLRFALFGLLWLFVFLIAGVLRQDLFGPRVPRNRSARRKGRAAAESPVAAAMSGGSRASAPVQSGAPPAGGGYTASPTLVLTSGAQAGMSLMLGTGQLTIGRAEDCGLIIDDDYASSHHARVYPQAGSWVLEDTNSTNGTYVNGARLTAPVRLGPGSRFTIGSTTMELRA